MCGIAGVLTYKDPGSDIRESMARAAGSLTHRGPDDSGVFCGKDERCRIALIHTRLSIIDLSPLAHQPMFNEDNSLVLVCNGEIYNCEELRKELLNKGHTFRSKSDNEVIIHLYEEKQEALLEDLRGMFAFCLWDKNKKKLFVARDHLGIKPLYYFWDGSTFIFASEVKAIADTGLFEKQLDRESLALYLKFGSIPSPKTIYKNVFSLVPANCLTIKNQKMSKRRYWNLTEWFVDDRIGFASEEEAVSLLRTQLHDSVTKHLISDVPVGVFLSGGVDSSSIVSLAREVSNNHIKTISAVFPDTSYDESKFAGQIAATFNTEHIEVNIPKDDLKSHIDCFLTSLDQPTIDGLNTYLVAWAAKQAGLKVCLSGLGGDELFGGYPSFWQVPRIYNYLRIADNIKMPQYILSLATRISGHNKTARLSDMFSPQFSFDNTYLNYRGIFSNNEICQLLGCRSLPDCSEYLSESTHEVDSALDKVSILEMSFYMANQLLRDNDVFGMHHSVEIRVPFVDRKLLEFSARVPNRYKYQKNPNKHFLIKAVGNLPREIYQRPKKGFTLPLDIWMKGHLKGYTEDCISKASFLDKHILRNFWNRYNNGHLHWSKIWALTAAQSWANNNL